MSNAPHPTRNPSDAVPPNAGTSNVAASTPSANPHYTIIIRCPFPRGDFVDPPLIEWDASKDRALWKVISRTSEAKQLDWEDLASRFQVSHAFILQQAAWLYERHLSHIRAQLGRKSSAAVTDTTAWTGTIGGIPMKRLGSAGSRTTSALSLRSTRDSPIPRQDSSAPGTPRVPAPTISRTPSTTTITQSRVQPVPQSPRAPLQKSFRASISATHKSSGIGTPSRQQQRHPDSPSTPSSNSESSSSDDDRNERQPLRRSQIFKRPPRYQSRKSALSRVDDEDEDEEESLPFASRIVQKSHAPQRKTSQRNRQDDSGRSRPSQASRNTPSTGPSNKAKGKGREQAQFQLGDATNDKPPQVSRNPSSQKPNTTRPSQIRPPAPESLTSSASSAAAPTSRPTSARPLGPLSPRHRAELGRALENRHVRSTSATGSVNSGGGQGDKEGSEGTPGMGSSFSDLDGEGSVTQSALEEALLSGMQRGGFSGLSSLRSRYL